MAGVEDLVSNGSTARIGLAGIERVDGIALDFGDGGEAEALAAEKFHEVGEHEGGEVGFVEEEYVRDFVAEGDDLLFAADADELGGVFHIALLEPVDAGLVVFGEAAAVGVVPVVVLKIEGDLGDAVAVLEEPAADSFALVERVPFFEVGITEPVPVAGGIVLAEDGLVEGDVMDVGFGGGVVERGMIESVIADVHAGGKPEMERLLEVRIVADVGCINEAVDTFEVVDVQLVDEAGDDADTGFVDVEAAGGGDVVEGESDDGVALEAEVGGGGFGGGGRLWTRLRRCGGRRSECCCKCGCGGTQEQAL